MSEPLFTFQKPTELNIKSRLQERRLAEMVIRDEILLDLRMLNLGVRATKLFCEQELGYSEIETRALLIELGLIITSEALVASDPVVRLKIEKLRNWRRERSRMDGVAAYRILSNRTLIAVASQPVRSAADLKGIKGLGETKIRQFATELIDLMGAP